LQIADCRLQIADWNCRLQSRGLIVGIADSTSDEMDDTVDGIINNLQSEINLQSAICNLQ